MRASVKGKVALVTGGGRGIGSEIAIALARAGADVVICGRSPASLRSCARTIRRSGRRVRTHVLDATHSRDVRRMFASVIRRIGRLDILVNNVGGVRGFGAFEALRDSDWEQTLALNLMSMVYVTREALPYLRRSPSGRILNIASLPAHQPGVFNPHYAASKAAVLNLSKYLANSLAEDGILVNTICPSTLKGGGWASNVAERAKRDASTWAQAEARMIEEENGKSPLGRMGMPEDVADLVVFLASRRAKFITGTCIDVDGGISRSIL